VPRWRRRAPCGCRRDFRSRWTASTTRSRSRTAAGLYLVGRDGRIAYQGGEGPFGFDSDELAGAIDAELARL